MEDSTQIDFPTVPNPPFPPWSLQGPISRDEPSTPVGVSRSPLPSIGFPVDRAKNTLWEFEFSSNRPLGSVVHPWQVAANGDNTVTVNEGTILVPNYRGTDDEDRAPIIYEPVTFAGDDDLQITAAGYLYARLEYPAILSGLQISWLDGSGLSPGFGAGLSIRNADAISVIFSSSDPATISPANTYTHWPIAQVDLQDGVASVTKQLLTHNLTHDLVYIHVSSSP